MLVLFFVERVLQAFKQTVDTFLSRFLHTLEMITDNLARTAHRGTIP